MDIRFVYDNEQEFNKAIEKLIVVHYETDRIGNKYIIILKSDIIEKCLDFINKISVLNANNIEMSDRLIGELIKKLLVIHNRIVLNEEIEE